jgi:hypothetical protein
MRINQLLDPDNASSYAGGGAGGANPSLSRSTSLGGAFAGRNRRPRAQDDLEGAFHDDGDAPSSAYAASAYYTPSHAHTQSTTSTGSADPYSTDSYFTPANGLSPRRANTIRDPPTSAVRVDQSPRSAALTDPYAPPPSQPPSSSGAQYASYGYDRQPQQNRTNPPTPYGNHSRSHSRVSADAYQSPPQSGGYGGAGYPMDVSTSPNPPGMLGAPPHTIASHSAPTSPHSIQFHPTLAPSPYYSATDHHAMVVEPPPPPRRVEGFRRVRDARDLQPRAGQRSENRRLDPMTGEFLSVSVIASLSLFFFTLSAEQRLNIL